MGVERRLFCDVTWCAKTFPVGPGQTIAQARAEAAKLGWVSPVQGRDACPGHGKEK